jgi:tetratricopeptide (TPR) repeat protein
VSWPAALALALLPMPRSLRHRLRLALPGAARRADRLAAAALPAIAVASLALLMAAALPGSPTSLRLWSLGAAAGLATGIPFALERRRLRRRAGGIPAPREPEAVGPHTAESTRGAAEALDAGDLPRAAALLEPLREARDPEVLRLAALVSARAGRARAARLEALGAAQLDPARWDALLDVGSSLCRRGRFAEGVRLLQRGAELSGRSPAALLALASGEAVAGRLHEAVSALDEAGGVSGPRAG